MPKWPWIERTFSFDYPPDKLPDVLERLRGTPVRIEAQIAGLEPSLLTRHPDDGWSIQENIGHIINVEGLAFTRIDEILADEDVLTAADMTNRRTREADHNSQPIDDLLESLRSERTRLIDKFESLDPADWGEGAMHPRLQQPMRVVDIATFHAEHDDYHLARITELIRLLT